MDVIKPTLVYVIHFVTAIKVESSKTGVMKSSLSVKASGLPNSGQDEVSDYTIAIACLGDQHIAN